MGVWIPSFFGGYPGSVRIAVCRFRSKSLVLVNMGIVNDNEAEILKGLKAGETVTTS